MKGSVAWCKRERKWMRMKMRMRINMTVIEKWEGNTKQKYEENKELLRIKQIERRNKHPSSPYCQSL